MFFDEKQLLEWKINFLKEHVAFIQKKMRPSLLAKLKSFIMEEKNIKFEDEELSDFLEENKADFIVNSCVYVLKRQMGFKWDGFFEFLLKNNNFRNKIHFLKDDGFYPKYIRQCRPDKEFYDYTSVVNVGFYNKNKDFLYICYDDEKASAYLRKEFGGVVEKVYNSIGISQAKSDFFLIASLFKEGGISADVCSVAQTSIKPLIQDCNLCFVYDSSGVNKNFLFAGKGSSFYEAYLLELIKKQKTMKEHKEFNYESFSSRNAFHTFFLDYYAYNIKEFEKEKINFIENEIYNAFVNSNMEEENLSEKDAFKKISFKALSKELNDVFICVKEDTSCVSENFYTAKSDNVCLIGGDLHSHITNQTSVPYALPTLDVLKLQDAYLSGHACLWVNDKYVDFESYLSSVAEQEHHGGFWKKPNGNNVARVVEDETIIGFSAGYGCYGHYIVDDLPRIGLIKKYLGDDFYGKKIILPQKTPRWGVDLLKYFLNIEETSFVFFNHETEVVGFKNLFAASYPHKNYKFHPFIKEFYDGISKKFISSKPFRRVCLSRKSWETEKVNQRIFLEQDFFEETAKSRGFDLIQPEKLKIEEQIELMAQTSCQIGEHGSAQHASVYNPFGMTIGTINPLTEVQVNLGRIYNDRNFICYADHQYNDNKGNFYYSVNKEKLIRFFDEIEKYEERKANLVAPKELFRFR
ncbi:glycosyltransferase family 61 protein [Acetobacter tropicalis]|uniref:glycosyltransferase family 61 protein n=5 Tax=Acetobacter tropicalis TaxID=104102 RepID=UPI0014707958|nr:glycosyltransferase family 61 protein [Acetobacter tropicalis]